MTYKYKSKELGELDDTLKGNFPVDFDLLFDEDFASERVLGSLSKMRFAEEGSFFLPQAPTN